MYYCGCGNEIVPPERHTQLGYNTCLKCGNEYAKTRRVAIVPMHKSNYVVMFNQDDLKGINNKGGLIK